MPPAERRDSWCAVRDVVLGARTLLETLGAGIAGPGGLDQAGPAQPGWHLAGLGDRGAGQRRRSSRPNWVSAWPWPAVTQPPALQAFPHLSQILTEGQRTVQISVQAQVPGLRSASATPFEQERPDLPHAAAAATRRGDQGPAPASVAAARGETLSLTDASKVEECTRRYQVSMTSSAQRAGAICKGETVRQTRGIMRRTCAVAAPIILATCLLGGGTAQAATNQVAVSPRNMCGGFNGNIYWSEDPITKSGYIHVWGDLWNNQCPGGTVYLYLSWVFVPDGQYENPMIASALYSATANTGVNVSGSATGDNYSGIEITVCSEYEDSWNCGTPVSV